MDNDGQLICKSNKRGSPSIHATPSSQWQINERASPTDNREINFHIPCRGVAKVDAAPVDPLVLELDVVDEELGGVGGGAKVGTARKGSWRRPQFHLRQVPCPHVEAKPQRKREGEKADDDDDDGWVNMHQLARGTTYPMYRNNSL